MYRVNLKEQDFNEKKKLFNLLIQRGDIQNDMEKILNKSSQKSDLCE